MTKLYRLALAICVATTLHFTASSQSLSINTTGAVADPSAILDVTSTTKGVLVTRMDKTQKNALAAPANGLLVYQTGPDSIGFHYYDLPNTRWVFINASGFATDTIAWKTRGNTGLADTSSFFGNIDNVPLNFRQNNTKAGRIDNINGNVFFGNNAGNDTAVGYVNIGNNAGAGINNGLPGVNIGSNAGRLSNAANANSVNIGVRAGESQAGNTSTQNVYIGAAAGQFNKAGGGNVGIGQQALRNDTTGTINTAVGYLSMVNGGNGSANSALGGYSLQNHVTGSYNTAIGYEAMQLDSAGGLNVAIGWRALRNNKIGVENTALGVGALEADSSGNFNTAVGRYAGFLNKRGSLNVSVGMQSGVSNDTADVTTFVGFNSGYYNKNNYNTGIGAYALSFTNFTTGSSTTGAENTGLGYGAGYRINLGSKNTAVGYQAMNSGGPFISGNRNVAVGDSSLFDFSNGNDNVGIGFKALSKAGASSQHVAVGSRALYNNFGSYPNTAVGYSSMDSATTATANTAVGSYSLTANKAGINNVAVGNAAMYESTLGNNNTAVGNDAGRLIRNNQNTAIGSAALRNDSTGTNNVAVGYRASFESDTASAVTAIGTDALFFNTLDSNVAIGYRAGRLANSNASFPSKEQTFVGTFAGLGSFVSSKNTAVGFRALAQTNSLGASLDYNDGGRNTVIGDSAMAGGMGAFNVAVGTQVMSTSGISTFRNVGIGDSAMINSVSPVENTAVGFRSLAKTANVGNTATGAFSARNVTTGFWNTVNGAVALENATSSSQNTAIGVSSFRSNISNGNNVGVGMNTGYNVTSGNNTFLGAFSGEGAAGFSTGGSNTGAGYLTLSDIRSGTFNTAVGRQALTADTSGSYNVAVGGNALINNLASDFNTGVGYNSLLMHKRVGFTYNTGLGSFALEQDSIGYHNTGVGTSAFRSNKTGFINTGVGINAGYYQKESYNTYVGGYSGFGLRSSTAYVDADTGNYNSGLGAYSLHQIANGSSNVAMGYSAMYSDSSGSLNTAVGNGALYSNRASHTNQAFGWNALYSYAGTTDGWNNAFGDRAAQDLVTGTQNVVMGSWSFLGHTSGNLNTSIGNWAMGNGGTTGTSNTALGAFALWRTNADGNVGIGNAAGQTNTSGTFNTLLGSFSDVSSSGLVNATAIGYNSRVAASNAMVLGASGTNVGINETSPNARLHIVRSGVSGGAFHVSSSAIIEDNTTSYLQFSNPNANETGLLSGNSSTTIRSAMIFRPDSSIHFRSGGNTTTMTIDNTNFVGIGTITPANLLHLSGGKLQIGTGETLEDFGAFLLGTNSSFVPITDASRSLGLAANRWTTVYATVGAINTSDARDKENITDLNYGLKEVMKLRPVSFSWKENPQWGKKIGFIAQEVQPVLKEVIQVGELKSKNPTKDADNDVTKKETDKLGIYYSDIIPVTVKAIQEQQQTIETQQKQIEDLKKKNEQLEKDMLLIKSKLGIKN